MLKTIRVKRYPPHHKKDPRFSPFVQEMHDNQRRSIRFYLEDPQKETLAEATDGEYTVVITKGDRVLFKRNDLPDMPAGSGKWMDWPEKDWGLTKEEYYQLSEEERAQLEAEEQLNKWVGKQFEDQFVGTWCPKEHDDFWWSGGADLARTNMDDYLKVISKMFGKCLRRYE